MLNPPETEPTSAFIYCKWWLIGILKPVHCTNYMPQKLSLQHSLHFVLYCWHSVTTGDESREIIWRRNAEENMKRQVFSSFPTEGSVKHHPNGDAKVQPGVIIAALHFWRRLYRRTSSSLYSCCSGGWWLLVLFLLLCCSIFLLWRFAWSKRPSSQSLRNHDDEHLRL